MIIKRIILLIEDGVYIIIILLSDMSKYLNSQVIKKRNRNSAISISCEMSVHIVELLFELMFLFSDKSFYYQWNFLWFVYQFEFPVKSICQAFSTETGRKWVRFYLSALRRRVLGTPRGRVEPIAPAKSKSNAN